MIKDQLMSGTRFVYLLIVIMMASSFVYWDGSTLAHRVLLEVMAYFLGKHLLGKGLVLTKVTVACRFICKLNWVLHQQREV